MKLIFIFVSALALAACTTLEAQEKAGPVERYTTRMSLDCAFHCVNEHVSKWLGDAALVENHGGGYRILFGMEQTAFVDVVPDGDRVDILIYGRYLGQGKQFFQRGVQECLGLSDPNKRPNM